MSELHVSEQWQEPLAAAGLESFGAMMASTRGECFSRHTRGQTYRLVLGGGEAVFLKRDCYTTVKDISADLLCLRRPQPPCVVEARAIGLVSGLGIPAADVIAWGQRRKAGLPWHAVLLTRELAGVPLHQFLKADPPPQRRREAIAAAAKVAGRLFRARLSWRDMRPKHFLLDGESVGVIDLARLRPSRLPGRLYVPKQLRRFCAALRECSGDEGDVKAFLEAVEREMG